MRVAALNSFRLLPRRHSRLVFRAYATASRLTSPTSQDVAHFAGFLPESSIITSLEGSKFSKKAESADLEQYNADWMGKYMGKSRVVLRPKTTEDVSKIMKHCWERRIGVVPQGGNTGLVGGGVPVNDEVVLNLSAMNSVRSFDPVSGILVADAGCVLEVLSQEIAPHGYIMPVDLGAKGSCHIGGNVATNAGGLRLLRYGSLHGTVLGLEVVLPDGTIIDQLSTLRKDNTGYDLKQLFIGAEGTLGVITGVSILTPPMPQSTNNIVLALNSFESVLPIFKKTRTQLSEILSAFEYFDRNAYNLVVKHKLGKSLAEDEIGDASAFVLIETSGGNKEHDEAKLQDFLEEVMSDESLVKTGVLAQATEQFQQLWSLRECIPEAVSKEGKAYKYDISVPITTFEEVVHKTREQLKSKNLYKIPGGVKEVVGYGHIGDGNLHLNVVAEKYSPEVEGALEPFIYELVASHRGSISAEHGIGLMKAHALQYSKSKESIALMKRIKHLFDERGIMNPGKVLE
ncbi:probable DLD2-D-lactate dehydrogenase [Serendipita indica DSM 11827]|uniref:Probable DLD2-D-lactate dehydrogenase n=1 Tax=Serendipita indica (strain DSM 11827) TaxID=1109443 RepID=G4TW40_SERID|nr:probable DLD2-D-lactate dehydrogenase [Serendipita indica DSM 11827]